MHARLFLALAFAAVVPVTLSAQRGGPTGPQQTSTPEPLKFRYMGPAPAGRIASVAGVPGDPNTYYLGSASGGVWKSTDGGKTFVPIFDDQTVAAIGAIAVAASDPNIVWAGTGEAWAIRDSDVMGDGIYKSTDAGTTWKHMGLRRPAASARILIHPTNPNIVFVCALGRLTGPQQERGVFKTDRRRRDLAARAVRRREHRLLGPRHGREGSRTRCSPARGRSRCTRGRSSAAGRAAAST